MRWVGHVVHIEEKENMYSFSGIKPEGKRHLEELGPHARAELMLILNKYNRRAWMRSSWLKIGASGGML
jgi:hypothetical protein